jgi:L-ascorbate metabolism protein UlaG (beta-lactamase superfamily)
MKISRKMFIQWMLGGIAALAASGYGVLQLPQFGAKAKGRRKQRMLAASNFKNGTFVNQIRTPRLPDGVTYWDILLEYIKKHPNVQPPKPLPYVQTDLKNLDLGKNQLVWFGHSSYLLILEGKRILVDPVFSGYASPFSFSVKAFPGTNFYQPQHMPDIDLLILTHDHYDHTDYNTLLALKPKIKQIITSLGVGAHLERWGFAESMVHEMNWDESYQWTDSLTVKCVTARHFSGRGITPETTLWSSFVLAGTTQTVFVGGDSGYGPHFKQIGQDHGPFDLALLDGAQYHAYWKDIHMNPEECVQAALDLVVKQLFPVHWGKFQLALHPWNESILRLTKACDQKGQNYLTAPIGMPVEWQSAQRLDWWQSIS